MHKGKFALKIPHRSQERKVLKMVDIHCENNQQEEGKMSLHMGVAGYKDDVEFELACIPAASVQAYVQRMQQEDYSREEIRLSVQKLIGRIDAGIRHVVTKLVKEGDL